jgi:signal transduction histidine kinase
MKLRTKTIITVALMIILLFVALQTATYFVLQPSFIKVDHQESIEQINQVRNIIDYRISTLEVNVKDYAFWDESYNFVQNENDDYVLSNFVDSTFENLNLNLVAIVKDKTDLIYFQSFDLNTSAKIQTPEETRKALISDSYIWEFKFSDNPISGLLVIGNKSMLFASAPILTSQKEGPVEGGMLFGKYVDTLEIAELSKIVSLDFSLNTIPDFQLLNKDNQIANALLSNKQTLVLKENSPDTTSGYTLFNDVHSNPMFILGVTHSRIAYVESIFVRNVFLITSIIFSILFGLTILFLLEREIIRPMTKLASYVEEISLNTNASASNVLNHATEEVAAVTNAVKNTLKRKFEGMTEVSRMVAHDLRNPLAGIKNASFFLKKKYGPAIGENGQVMLQTIDDCVAYSDKIVQNLMDYSSEIKLELVKTSPKKLVDKALSKFMLPSNIKLINEASDEVSLSVDIAKIERVFTNLIVNALDAMPTGGTLRVTSKKVKDTIQIDFSDTGGGMSKDVLEKLWLPFFTTKAKGMGIGLSICKRIVDFHEGKIEVQSVEGKGTCFSVFLQAKK